MQLAAIARYPIKGLTGEALTHTTLTKGHGVPGDRRFAFGVDASKDDGTWYSSRNYLINSRKDNLLKFAMRGVETGWEVTSPTGHVLGFDTDNPDSIKRFNEQIGPFLSCVENAGATPCLIDRNPAHGPKGHWDFPDSEVLVINLATLRALEHHWGHAIDPRRFRANLLVDGLPAWSEFGLYGAAFTLGGARIDILRPARRCAALSVNPTTGDRDFALQNDLVKDFGHGFFGVYARVSQSGEVAVGDALHPFAPDAVAPQDMTCDIAPDVALWPKVAKIIEAGATGRFDAFPTGALPLAETGAGGRMKLHLRPGLTLSASIHATTETALSLTVNDPAILRDAVQQSKDGTVVLSGPFPDR